jgi:hypothetical protein
LIYSRVNNEKSKEEDWYGENVIKRTFELRWFWLRNN